MEEYPVNHSPAKPIWAMTASFLLLLAASMLGCAEKSPPTELVSTDIVVGDGKEALAGKSVSVHYTGWLFDGTASDNRGTKFDSSRDRGLPFTFTLGRGVIKGWSQGVEGMKVGGVRELVIPPDLGYGSRGAPGGAIPPNSTLVFEIELIVARD
jgi:FKBP-type peptidyl-prolyl cis-trans isomerase FkpA